MTTRVWSASTIACGANHATVLDKTHMPYALNARRMQWLSALFLAADYTVASLPPYEPRVAANPFIAFGAIRAESRWRFLLEDARHTVMNRDRCAGGKWLSMSSGIISGNSSPIRNWNIQRMPAHSSMNRRAISQFPFKPAAPQRLLLYGTSIPNRRKLSVHYQVNRANVELI